MLESMLSYSVNKLLEDFEQLRLWNFSVAVLVDGLDKLVDLLAFDIPIAAKALEGIVDEAEDFVALQGARLVVIVFAEDGVDGLSELVVARFLAHFK